MTTLEKNKFKAKTAGSIGAVKNAVISFLLFLRYFFSAYKKIGVVSYSFLVE